MFKQISEPHYGQRAFIEMFAFECDECENKSAGKQSIISHIDSTQGPYRNILPFSALA